MLSASALSSLAGCEGGVGTLLGGGREAGPGRAALLVPLSGPRAQLGRIMADAASLGATTPGFDPEIATLDSGDTAESAAAAAAAAREAGVRMILGPLFGAQAGAVARAAGRGVPVVTFSNDPALVGAGVFVFGVTPVQSAQAALGFAAARGLRRIGIVVPPGEFGARTIAGVRGLAPALGLSLASPVVTADGAGLAGALRAAGGGALPDAAYLPSAGPELASLAAGLAGSGVRILGSTQWSGINPLAIPALRGAWFAAPDPLTFEPFRAAFEARFGGDPGIIAGLAFDAVEMARILGRIGQQDRDGLLRERGFDGVLGPYRFSLDGRCRRGLAVLAVEADEIALLGAMTA